MQQQLNSGVGSKSSKISSSFNLGLQAKFVWVNEKSVILLTDESNQLKFHVWSLKSSVKFDDDICMRSEVVLDIVWGWVLIGGFWNLTFYLICLLHSIIWGFKCFEVTRIIFSNHFIKILKLIETLLYSFSHN